MKRWIDLAAALLLLLGGMFSLLDSFLENQYELIPLSVGLALLLLNHGKKQPLRYLYLALLLIMLRVILKGDERFIPAEITLNDYILIALAFSASYLLLENFWRLLLPLLAIFLPLSALLSHQIRPSYEKLEAFHSGGLSINQTSFLLGACLTLSLCFAWNSLSIRRPMALRLLLTFFWLWINLITLFLILETQSRSGLGLPLIVFAGMLALAQRKTLKSGLKELSQSLAKRLPGTVSLMSTQSISVAVLLCGIGLLIAACTKAAMHIYANKENMVSDLHRLHLLKCYFGALFTGHNRLIYGLGFTNASQTVCSNIGLIKDTTHAHNIYAQIAADSGVFAMVLVVCITLWYLKKAFNQIHSTTIKFASSCLYVYLFLFLQIEGGWGKVTFLQILIGLSVGALSMDHQENDGSNDQVLRTGFQ